MFSVWHSMNKCNRMNNDSFLGMADGKALYYTLYFTTEEGTTLSCPQRAPWQNFFKIFGHDTSRAKVPSVCLTFP